MASLTIAQLTDKFESENLVALKKLYRDVEFTKYDTAKLGSELDLRSTTLKLLLAHKHVKAYDVYDISIYDVQIQGRNYVVTFMFTENTKGYNCWITLKNSVDFMWQFQLENARLHEDLKKIVSRIDQDIYTHSRIFK